MTSEKLQDQVSVVVGKTDEAKELKGKSRERAMVATAAASMLTEMIQESGGCPTLEAALKVASRKSRTLREAAESWEKRHRSYLNTTRSALSAFWTDARLAELPKEYVGKIRSILANYTEDETDFFKKPATKIIRALEYAVNPDEYNSGEHLPVPTRLSNEMQRALKQAQVDGLARFEQDRQLIAASLGLTPEEAAFVCALESQLGSINVLRNVYAQAWNALAEEDLVPKFLYMNLYGEGRRQYLRAAILFTRNFENPTTPFSDELFPAHVRIQDPGHREDGFYWIVVGGLDDLGFGAHSDRPRHVDGCAGAQSLLRFLGREGVDPLADAEKTWSGILRIGTDESIVDFYQYPARADGLVPIITITSYDSKSSGCEFLLATPELMANPDWMSRVWGVPRQNGNALKAFAPMDKNAIRTLMGKRSFDRHLRLGAAARQGLGAFLDAYRKRPVP